VVTQPKTRLQLHKNLIELSQLISHSLVLVAVMMNQLPLLLQNKLLHPLPAGLYQIINAVLLVMLFTLTTTIGVLKMVIGKLLNYYKYNSSVSD